MSRGYRTFAWLYVLSGLSLIGLGMYWGWASVRRDWLLAVTTPIAVYYLISGLIRIARANRRRKWIDAGLCGRCGYDLRASRGRCPECGEAIHPEKDA